MSVYVNNEQMLADYKVWYAKHLEAKEAGLPRPEIPRPLADAIVLICTRLANRYNFNNYSYRDDMTADAILECVKYFHCFNPEISNFIFSYFTRVAFQAFVGRINKERKQSYIKGKIVQQMDISEFVDGADQDTEGLLDAGRVDYYNIDTTVYQNHIDRKKRKKTETVDLVD